MRHPKHKGGAGAVVSGPPQTAIPNTKHKLDLGLPTPAAKSSGFQSRLCNTLSVIEPRLQTQCGAAQANSMHVIAILACHCNDSAAAQQGCHSLNPDIYSHAWPVTCTVKRIQYCRLCTVLLQYSSASNACLFIMSWLSAAARARC
jgi:hypothetical protein